MKNAVVLVVSLIVVFNCCKSSKAPDMPAPPVDTTPVVSTTFKNPLLQSGPDPWVVQKDGFYYYTQTSGNKILLWKTPHIEDLRKASPVTVWQPAFGSAFSTDIWAPEIQFINGKWYIYFAADDNGNNDMHRVFALENEATDPTTGTWTFKGKVAAATDKWAIDADVFAYNGNEYITWSGWQGSVDGEQDIFIARLANPWTIDGDRVLISRPTYAWETNNQAVLVNEGPEGLNHNGKLFLTFSAGGCWTDDYCLGLLTLKNGGDPMNAADWTKTPTPVFTKNTNGGAYGPGHNGFFKSPDSTQDWIIYHANATAGQGCGDSRSPRIQPFTWNSDGSPDFGTPVSLNVLITKPSGE